MAAGDFTNIRVESNAWDNAIIRYDYAGANTISLWRAPNGGAFAKIITIPSTYGSYPLLYDGSLAAETYYDYKLSDDDGSTFTSVYSVQSHKRFPETGLDETYKTALPTFENQDDVSAENVQTVVDQVEGLVNHEGINAPRPCEICPTNGAIVLDCANGCYRFIVKGENLSDINSISINCKRAEIDLEVASGTTIEVCGWEEQTDFEGDECYQAPISSPVTQFPIAYSLPVCPVRRRRYLTYPCQEYMQDCYDRGSLRWSSSGFTMSLADCGGAPGQGCCSGNNSHGLASESGSALVISGFDVKGKPDPFSTAGYSLLFGRSGGTPGLPWDISCKLGVNTKVSGSPIYGIAINVPVTATVQDFTGLVMLVDYPNSRTVVGTFANANLRAGIGSLSILHSGPIDPDMKFLFISNFPSVGSGDYYVLDSGGLTLDSWTDAGVTAPSTNLLGCGYVWVANTTQKDNHIGSVWWDDDSDISIWPS